MSHDEKEREGEGEPVAWHAVGFVYTRVTSKLVRSNGVVEQEELVANSLVTTEQTVRRGASSLSLSLSLSGRNTRSQTDGDSFRSNQKETS